MKNYLVKTLFEVKDTNWTVVDRSHENNLYENYRSMHDLSVKSFNIHLKGDWELKVLEGTVENIHRAFEKTFWFIYELWHSEACNILYTDPDTIATKSIDPWNNLNGFLMFNFTDPRSLDSVNRYNKSFKHFFNAGVRYFGHDMASNVWKTGEQMARNWDYSTYDTEQIILNEMLWMQGWKLDQVLRPEIAYQAQWLPFSPLWVQDIWNGISINEAAIIHLHGSRDSNIKLKLMKDISR
jgi:hypothetical protein